MIYLWWITRSRRKKEKDRSVFSHINHTHFRHHSNIVCRYHIHSYRVKKKLMKFEKTRLIKSRNKTFCACLSTTTTKMSAWWGSFYLIKSLQRAVASGNWRCKIFVFELAQQVQIKVWSWKFLPFLFNSSERENEACRKVLKIFFHCNHCVIYWIFRALF